MKLYKFEGVLVIAEKHDFKDTIDNMKKLIESSLEDAKAEDIVTIDLENKTQIADYMIIASGTSSRHTSSIAEKIVAQIKDISPLDIPHIEGAGDGNWVLVDTGDIVIHLFKPETRQLYNLEKMWSAPTHEAELAIAD